MRFYERCDSFIALVENVSNWSALIYCSLDFYKAYPHVHDGVPPRQQNVLGRSVFILLVGQDSISQYNMNHCIEH